MYADGDGVPRDDQRAFDYFSQIANSHPDEAPGTPQARFVANAFVALGHYYLTGHSEFEDRGRSARARDMFAYAATYFGDADAQYELGRLYLTARRAIRIRRRAGCGLPPPRAIAAPKARSAKCCSRGRTCRGRRARGLMWLILGRDCAGRGRKLGQAGL